MEGYRRLTMSVLVSALTLKSASVTAAKYACELVITIFTLYVCVVLTLSPTKSYRRPSQELDHTG